MQEYVPPSTKVRPSKVRNIDSDRLSRRLTWLLDNRARIAREADGRPVLRQFAREVHTIAGEMARRQGNA